MILLKQMKMLEREAVMLPAGSDCGIKLPHRSRERVKEKTNHINRIENFWNAGEKDARKIQRNT